MHDVRVIVLAGSPDFGRCPIASRLPASLWPVLQQSAIERVIRHVAAQEFREISVCSEGNIGSLKSLTSRVGGVKIDFVEEPLRVGTAGCLRDAVSNNSGEIIVIISASIVRTPDINRLINAHIEQKADLTAVLNPAKSSRADSTGIYICSNTVLEHIPQYGYCDIKEGLVPEMLKQGKVLKTVELSRDVENFRGGPGYLRAMTNFLENQPALDEEVPTLRRRGGENIYADESADIDPSAKLLGPVAVMAGAKVAKGTVVFGPAVIGKNCRLGGNSFVACSVLWDNAVIEPDCEVQNCLLDYNVRIAGDTVVRNKIIPFEKSSVMSDSKARAIKLVGSGLKNPLPIPKPSTEKVSVAGISSWIVWLAGAVIAAVFVWSYWPGIVDLCSIWRRSDEYSSGILVPFLAGYILWSRRDKLRTISIRPALWGFIGLLFAEGLRLFGLFFMYGSAERLAIVVGLIALVLIVLGWEFFKKTAFVMLFLFLMLPWPNSVQAAVALPLQQWSTSSAVFCLEMLGYDVFREGNIIHIGQFTVAVAEACNGLRMITAFFVISGLVVLLVRRKWWEKLTILASSLPVALLCNTTRLALTAIAFTWLEGDYWEKIFHDFGGYAMMPLALAIVVLELWLIDRLTVQPVKAKEVIISAK
ncbi:MAG: exosortase [Sedimentisphaerales bacterium]|nr:exosortase [Sedimentisphaerales bacterium]